MCEDCDARLQGERPSDDVATLCARCASQRVERKAAILELVDTEISYGKDLKVIREARISKDLCQKHSSLLLKNVYEIGSCIPSVMSRPTLSIR